MAKISIERLGLGKGKGLLSRMRAIIDRHSDFIEYTVGADGITVSQNARGGVTIRYSARGGARSAGTWSGIVWYLGEQKWDFSREGAVLGAAELEGGIYLGGKYLKVKLADGSTAWADERATPTDTDEWSYFWVATRFEPEGEDPYYALNGHTCGDIRVDFVPYIPEDE